MLKKYAFTIIFMLSIFYLTFAQERTFSLPVSEITSDNLQNHHSVIGDFDGNGTDDLAWVDSVNSQGKIFVGFSEGNGNFRVQHTQDLQNSISDIVNYNLIVGDFDGNGTDDLAWIDSVNSQGKIFVGSSLGNGNFTIQHTQDLQNSISDITNYNLIVGDFDGNGTDDLAWVDSVNSQGKIFVGSSLGNGNFTIQHTQNLENNIPNIANYKLAVGDFDGDTLDDILWNLTSETQNLVHIGFNIGGGNFYIEHNEEISSGGGWQNYELLIGNIDTNVGSDLVWNEAINSGNTIYTALNIRFGNPSSLIIANGYPANGDAEWTLYSNRDISVDMKICRTGTDSITLTTNMMLLDMDDIIIYVSPVATITIRDASEIIDQCNSNFTPYSKAVSIDLVGESNKMIVITTRTRKGIQDENIKAIQKIVKDTCGGKEGVCDYASVAVATAVCELFQDTYGVPSSVCLLIIEEATS